MKPSKFNIITRSKDDATKQLLYNTLHDHRILFDDPELNPQIFFDKVQKKLPLTEKESDAISELKEMGVLLEDEVDEQKVFNEWYQTKIRERTDIMQVSVVPTMACNLACDYCFENDVRENGVMKPETTEKIIAFLKKKIMKVRPQSLHLHFFGGEALLHPTPIKKIMKELWEFAQPLGIPIRAGLTTNGVLLTSAFVDEMVPYGLQWAKITFDGDREAHDKKRIYHNRKGTFDVIYNNLCTIQGKIQIAIGGNFDNENYESFFGLIERLKQSPFADDIMSARFKPIIQPNPDLASQRQGRVSSFCEVCSYNTAQINGMMALQEKTCTTGLSSYRRPELGPCEYHNRHAFTIGPDGSLYKCPGFIGLHNLVAGSVDQDEFNEQGEWQVASRKWDDDCESCHFLPNCAGGCHFSALHKTGSLEVKNCDGKYLEQATETFMQKEIAVLSQEETEVKEKSKAA